MAEFKDEPSMTDESYLKEKVELFISCKDLVEKDFNSKSDPFVVVYIRDKSQKFQEIGRTEVIKDNSYPNFATQFKMYYYFEEEQLLRFDVYDEDKKGSKRLKDHDYIGSTTIILGELMHETGATISKKLLTKKGKTITNKKSKRYSSIVVTADKVAEGGNESLTIQIGMTGLPKMDGLFGKCDPYFIIKRQDKNVQIFKSEIIKKTLEPTFKSFTIESQKLCNCDPNKQIVIEVWDWDKNSSDDKIGSVKTTLNELRRKPQGLKISGKGKKSVINILQFSAKPIATFLEYLQGGAEISLMVAIDFTGSNGDPLQHGTLHNINKGPSAYQNAIRQIGNIVASYDADKKFPVWGFGGWIKWNQQTKPKVEHDFALNILSPNHNDINDPEVHGIYGVEQVYLNAINICMKGQKGSFPWVALSGPTLFAPILQKAKSIAQIIHKSDGLQYAVLLILTDGIINDMPATKDTIVEMANLNLPISIIIVGVGNANFSKMAALDGDENGLMNSKGQYAKRDIVQFVQMNKYKMNISGLSKETLKEVPRQFLSYVGAHGIAPGKKAKVVAQEFAVSDDEKQDQVQELPEINQQTLMNSNQYTNAPLPPGWERGYTDEGRVYYVDTVKQTTQWEYPMIK